ncbi:unnamed protein product [Brassicogethes aeneus]|uniref:Adenosine 3'-phospho 5'-phosphosulfate transporter 1 n=1 Tax=Brassicogethes aeneus TaxID=1431903 RepID=A0A9P0AT27_BRAAE|nr:unnamed protein product [Brassicogethes aeneus]
MAKNAELFICLIVVISSLLVYILNVWLLNTDLVQNPPEDYSWIIHGFRNILGYATLFLPGYLVYKYLSKTNYLNKSGRGVFGGIIRTLYAENELIPETQASQTAAELRTPLQTAVLLICYFGGLQISYLSWALLQEKVMTQKYENAEGEVEYFKDSQFLVFVNRILAFVMASIILFCTRQPRHKCPLYKYVFCSFSNIMSSWCQYEALKYVAFPHQVLAKASKTIPVMIMGKVMSKTKYEYYEYVTAGILSIGMLFFMLDTGNDKAKSTVTTFSGVIILCSYIIFDSFTSNWQGSLFKRYEMKPIQMMCFVNCYSCIFTAVSLLQQGGFFTSLNFIIKYPNFLVDALLLSVCSAAGQLFIFKTVATFGPLVFVIISTIRQGFSVLLSCLVYHHEVHALGIFGISLVFLSILLRIYCDYRIKSLKKQHAGIVKNQINLK